jgi:dienelactone hydrolase
MTDAAHGVFSAPSRLSAKPKVEPVMQFRHWTLSIALCSIGCSSSDHPSTPSLDQLGNPAFGYDAGGTTGIADAASQQDTGVSPPFGEAGPPASSGSDAATLDADVGGDAGTGTPPNEPPTVAACGQTKLYQVPTDPGETGPWPVGVKTVQVALPNSAGNITVEVWYPAAIGTDAGKTRKQYDLRDFLPSSERSKIPDDEATSPSLTCQCYSDLPLDTEHGPYPVVIYIHGTAAMRIASASTMTHWASRGFVVIAADHPGMYLADMLSVAALTSLTSCPGSGISQDVPRDIDAMMAAVRNGTGDLAFLNGHIDPNRFGMTGHSQGALNAAELASRAGVQVSIPLAGSTAVTKGPDLKSCMFLGGLSDKIVKYANQKSAYQSSPAPKRLVGISNAGHLVVTDLCGGVNKNGDDAVAVATKHGVCGINLAGTLWDCSTSYISQADGTAIVNYATAAELEETLHCVDETDAFANLKTRYPDVGEFLEQKQ